MVELTNVSVTRISLIAVRVESDKLRINVYPQGRDLSDYDVLRDDLDIEDYDIFLNHLRPQIMQVIRESYV